MNWKLFNKNTPDADDSSTLDPVAENSSAANQAISISNVKVPLTFLQKLIPIGDIEPKLLQTQRPILKTYQPGKRIFEQGHKITAVAYLVKGSVYLETDTGLTREINAETMAALYPLANGKTHHFTILANSQAKILCFPNTIVNHLSRPKTIADQLDIPEHLKNNSLYINFQSAYNAGKIEIPPLPDVAIKLGTAVNQDIGIADAVDIVSLDPVIAAKLIKTVNSPLYRTMTPAASCHDAVNRLGLKTTRMLVTSLSMKNLFTGKNNTVRKKFFLAWQQSIKIASISRALAQTTGQADPEEAMLAGLVHNIGAIPLLKYVDSRPEENYQDHELETCLAISTGIIGQHILKKWDFPDSLSSIPFHCSDWFHHSADTLNLCDIVILARFHSLIVQNKAAELPLLSTLPAFQKLGNNSLNPNLSLQALDQAKQLIDEAMRLFST